jgi:hypothetical protein
MSEDEGKRMLACLELPVFVDGLDGPIELLPQCLGEELFNRDVELLREDHGETRVDVVLERISTSSCITAVE